MILEAEKSKTEQKDLVKDFLLYQIRSWWISWYPGILWFNKQLEKIRKCLTPPFPFRKEWVITLKHAITRYKKTRDKPPFQG